jgi:hypothetical protein
MDSEVGKERFEVLLVNRAGKHRAVQALLTLALLEQKMIAAAALKRHFSASGTPDSLLCAAVGLELRHRKNEEDGEV